MPHENFHPKPRENPAQQSHKNSHPAPQRQARQNNILWRACAAFLVLVFALLVSLATGRDRAHPQAAVMRHAAERMRAASAVIAQARKEMGIPVNPVDDPNMTGLIGLEFTEITTSVGQLAAKRTATNPDFAALAVRYFYELGLKRGDKIALGASGSFPGIIIALLSACAATGIEPVIIASLGASEYGANIPGLSSAEMIILLHEKAVFPYLPAALSLGGAKDQGLSDFLLTEHAPSILLDIAQRAQERAHSLLGAQAAQGQAAQGQQQVQAALIREATLAKSIERRMEIYRQAGPIKAFVNIGGADANYGATMASLQFPNGLVRHPAIRAQGSERGLVFEYAERGIPVIHFLNIQGLAIKSGIPVDPVPLPEPGSSAVYRLRYQNKTVAVIGLLLALLVLFGVPRRR